MRNSLLVFLPCLVGRTRFGIEIVTVAVIGDTDIMVGPLPLWLLLAAVAGFAGTQENLSIPLQHPLVLVLSSFLVVRVLFSKENIDWVDLLTWTVATVLTLVAIAPVAAAIVGSMPASVVTHFVQPALTMILIGGAVEIGYKVFGWLVAQLTGEKASVQRTLTSHA